MSLEWKSIQLGCVGGWSVNVYVTYSKSIFNQSCSSLLLFWSGKRSMAGPLWNEEACEWEKQRRVRSSFDKPSEHRVVDKHQQLQHQVPDGARFSLPPPALLGATLFGLDACGQLFVCGLSELVERRHTQTHTHTRSSSAM